jgi:hypothetical protein
MKRLLLLAAFSALQASCARDPQPLAHRLFVPVVVRSDPRPGRITWRTRVSLSNPGTRTAFVRAFRWPPSDRSLEISEFSVLPGATVIVPTTIPPLPAISSLTIESDLAVTVAAAVEPREKPGPPSLPVPVLPVTDLARLGDRLIVSGLVSDEGHRSHFAFTFPWAEHDTVPFRVALAFRSPDGKIVSQTEKTIRGVPSVVEDPWLEFHLPSQSPLDLEVTFLASGRGRTPKLGLWVYGLVQDRQTRESRFLPVRVVRAGRP